MSEDDRGNEERMKAHDGAVGGDDPGPEAELKRRPITGERKLSGETAEEDGGEPPFSEPAPSDGAASSSDTAAQDPAERSPPSLTPGDQVCGFEIVKVLGAGGMGEVYEAKDATGEPVALKILNKQSRDKATSFRMEMEAKALKRTDHPNVVRHFFTGRDERVGLVIVTELLEGTDLHTLLRTCGALPVVVALAYANEIADATTAMHARGFYHRDIKPANIFIQSAREERPAGLKLLDFGMVKYQGAMAPKTASGIIVGTARYMSPEQVRGEKLTPASDVWSIGHVLREMLCGEHPFDKRRDRQATPFEQAMWQLNMKFPPVSDLCYWVPPYVSAIPERCLQRNPLDRYQTAFELAKDLDAAHDRWIVDPARARGLRARQRRAPALGRRGRCGSISARAWIGRAGLCLRRLRRSFHRRGPSRSSCRRTSRGPRLPGLRRSRGTAGWKRRRTKRRRPLLTRSCRRRCSRRRPRRRWSGRLGWSRNRPPWRWRSGSSRRRLTGLGRGSRRGWPRDTGGACRRNRPRKARHAERRRPR
jgi:serine/threonine protein kinase